MSFTDIYILNITQGLGTPETAVRISGEYFEIAGSGTQLQYSKDVKVSPVAKNLNVISSFVLSEIAILLWYFLCLLKFPPYLSNFSTISQSYDFCMAVDLRMSVF
jgi:hypothetical protein